MGRAAGLEGRQQQMGFGEAKKVFQAEALAIGLLPVRWGNLCARCPPNQEPEGRPLGVRVGIQALAAEQIEGPAMHRIVAGAAHQQVRPSHQVQGKGLTVGWGAREGLLLCGCGPGSGVIELESGAVPARARRAAVGGRLAIESPVPAHSRNHHQIGIAPATSTTGRRGRTAHTKPHPENGQQSGGVRSFSKGELFTP